MEVIQDFEHLERLLERGRTSNPPRTSEAREAWDALEQALRDMVRRLVETQRFLDNILSSSTEYSIIAKDLERTILLWNEGARRNYGYEAHEVLGKKADMLHAPVDLETGTVERLHAKALKDGIAEGRFTRLRKDGSTFPASVVITPREDADGQPIGFLLISRDISTELEQERLKEAARDLEEQRTIAEQASRLKQEFVADVAHELRSPLLSIVGFSDLLLKSGLAERQTGHVHHVRDNGRFLLRLVGDLLDLSRLEARKQRFQIQEVDPSAVVQEVADSMAPVARDAGITVHREVSEATVLADPVRLRQALTNVLSNGIKFTPRGGSVTLRVLPRDGHVVIEAEDTGPGIPPSRLDKLFRPFERLGTASEGPPGTGLGLALTKRLVEAMGGSIVYEPGSEGGSLFRITLPAPA